MLTAMDTGSSDNHSTTPYTIDWLHPLCSLYLRTFLGGWAPSLDHVLSDWGEIARVADCHSQEFYSSGQTHFSLRFTFNFSRFSMNLLTVPITRSAAFDVRRILGLHNHRYSTPEACLTEVHFRLGHNLTSSFFRSLIYQTLIPSSVILIEFL